MIQEKILTNIAKAKELDNAWREIDSTIKSDARHMLKELKKIDGWEVMIQECLYHYKESTAKGYDFFGWCSIKYDEKSVTFNKGYSNGEDFDVITIKLDEPLEIQVNKARTETDRKQKEQEELERDKELLELKRLSKKYGKEIH